MEHTYLARVGWTNEYMFTMDGVNNPEKAREEYEFVCRSAEANNKIVEEQRREYSQISRELQDFFKNNGVKISTRKLNGLCDDIRRSKVTRHTIMGPRILAAWVEYGGETVKVPNSHPKNFDDAFKAVSNHRERIIRDKQISAAREKKAIEYCVENGLDWTPSTAVDVATDHYVESEINRMQENKATFSIGFCDYCSSWTAGDHRCSCGNRRVDFTYDGIYPEIDIYPEAW